MVFRLFSSLMAAFSDLALDSAFALANESALHQVPFMDTLANSFMPRVLSFSDRSKLGTT